MKASFKLDTSKWKAAFKELVGFPSKRPVVDLMKRAAGGVVRRVVSVTPPAKGKTDSGAKKRGEGTILSDLSRVMLPVTPKRGQALEDPVEVYRLTRNPRTGRVNGRFRKKRPVSRAEFNALKRKLFAKVGHLAAGFNEAAEKLGVSMPAWIKRHGNSHGVITIKVTPTNIRISFSNKVGFVDNVDGLERRLQWAVDVEAKSIDRQVAAILKKEAAKAGFKTS